MKFRRSLILRSFVVWTVFVWAVLVKNMVTDDEHALSFRLVHIGLAAISMAFAAASWPLAKRVDRSG